MEIELLSTDLLIPYEFNNVKHPESQVNRIANSISEFGFNVPIIVNADNIIIAGHGRFMAAKKLGITEVPVVRKDSLTPAQEKAYRILDNKLTRDSEWDFENLGLELEVLKDEGFDFKDWGLGDLNKLVEETAAASEEAQRLAAAKEDDFEAPPVDEVETFIKRGDLIELGRHRILCGSSFDSDVPGSEACKTIFYDPPWDVDIAKRFDGSSVLAFCDGPTAKNVIEIYGAPTWIFTWDCVSCWYTPNRPLRRAKLCLWYGDIESFNFNGAHYGDAGEPRTVWNTRGSYEFTPDPRGKHIADVFSQPITKLHADSEHKHTKPLDWIRLLLGTTSKGDVYDPFLGSGTTLIACEQLGRTCYGMELDPKYCQVIINRYHKFCTDNNKPFECKINGEPYFPVKL